MKSLSLGRLPWISPAYFKKTQASKLGDALGIPFFIGKIIRSSLVKLYFNSFTSYVLFLERLCAFIFSIALLFSIKLDWTLAFLIGRETRSAFSWEYSYSSLIFVEVFISSAVQLLALVFMYLLSELLAFFCRKYSLASLIFVWRVD